MSSNDSNLRLTGLHHVTAVTADAPGNLRFYTEVLGMRLVKKSVNQDDVSAYHLFYADGEGSPGTDLTFFDWPAVPERRGTRSVSRTGLRVHGAGVLEWWKTRLEEQGARAVESSVLSDRKVLTFEDPEGQRLLLIDDGGTGEFAVWEKSPVPPEYQIRGLGPVLLSVPELEPTAHVLTDLLMLESAGQYAASDDPGVAVHVFVMGGEGGPASEVHVAVQPGLSPARTGAGGVHHLALRVPDFDQYEEWRARLARSRMPFSGPVDRFYFRSLYFREPNGILFELATDGPGFATDEPMEKLGERLALPPFLEPRRAEIEAGLKPL